MENNVIKVWFENDNILIKTKTGDVKSHPLSWFPRLQNAPQVLLNKFTLSPFGIHWVELDEDLSFDGFFNFTNQSSLLEKK